ncbi:hypothetical protein cand_019330 [Cryptosporidium andersoni]|uniref:Uncharacterized protein n=1 Tax=Cryptosporidium andersoni TaxID=117008 RepID=A0A1J4MKD1_9CRYT|nr:hypothetical protein cand_019330 [Cryptosporidium andersoni]
MYTSKWTGLKFIHLTLIVVICSHNSIFSLMAKNTYSPNLKLQDESLSEDIKFELLKHTMGSKPNIQPADTDINTLDLKNEPEISNSLNYETPLLINKSNVEENIENKLTKEMNFEVASEYRSDEESQENDTKNFGEKSQEDMFDSSTEVTITPSNGPTFKKMNINYDKDEDTNFDSIELIKKQNREIPEFYYQGPQIKEYQGDNTNPNIKLNTATNRQYIQDQKVKQIEKYVGKENFPIINPIMTINKPVNISQSTVAEVNPAFNTLGSMGPINYKIIIPSSSINPVPTQNFFQAPINNKPEIIVKDSMIKKPKILTSKERIIPKQKEIIQSRPEIMQLTKKVMPIRNKVAEQTKVIPVPVKKVITPIKKKVEVIPAIKKLTIPKIPNKTVKYVSKPLTIVKQPPPMLQVINRIPTLIGHIQEPKPKLIKSKLRKRLIPVVTKKPKPKTQKFLATEKGYKLNNSRFSNEVKVKELKVIEPSKVVIKEIKPIPVKSQLMKQNTIKEQNFNQPNIIIQSDSQEKPQLESGILNKGILNYPLLSNAEFGIPNFQTQQLKIPDVKVMGETFGLDMNKALPSIPGRSYSNQAPWYRQSTILFILMIIIVIIGLGCFFLFYFSR